MKLLTLGILLFASNWALAQTPCANSRFFQGNVKVNTQTNSTGGCYLSVTPFNIKNLTYRDFLFDDNGLMMVFVSFGPGPVSSTTGAREFYLFPRVNKVPTYQVIENDSVLVTHPSGTIFRFPFQSGDLAEIDPGKVSVSSYFDPTEKSGVEFIQFKGLLLDTGFQMGETASGNPNRLSLFRDDKGNSCQVRNKELFNYLPGGDIEFKFATDAPLARLLSQRCPQLEIQL